MSAMHPAEKLLVNSPLASFLHRDVALPRLLRLAREPIEGPVLEIGCGQGATTEGLLKHLRLPTTAIDIDEEEVALARERLHGRATVEQGDATQLRFPDASFQTVIELNTLHHIRDWAKALAEVRRVLAPGGQFLFTDYTRETLFGIMDRPPVIVGRFTAAELTDALLEAGFSGVIVSGTWIVRGRGVASAPSREPLVSQVEVSREDRAPTP